MFYDCVQNPLGADAAEQPARLRHRRRRARPVARPGQSRALAVVSGRGGAADDQRAAGGSMAARAAREPVSRARRAAPRHRRHRGPGRRRRPRRQQAPWAWSRSGTPASGSSAWSSWHGAIRTHACCSPAVRAGSRERSQRSGGHARLRAQPGPRRGARDLRGSGAQHLRERIAGQGARSPAAGRALASGDLGLAHAARGGRFRQVGWPVLPTPSTTAPRATRPLLAPDAARRWLEFDEAIRAWIGLVAYWMTDRIPDLLPAP